MKKSPAFVLAGLLAIASALPAAAQEGHWLGIKAGYGMPSSSIDDSQFVIESIDESGGFIGGLSWEGGLKGNWTLETEVLYVKRSVKNTYVENIPNLGEISSDYSFTTLEIPFHAKYAFSAGATTPYLFAGWVTAIPIEIDALDQTFTGSARESAKNRFDKVWLALEIGGGIEHKLTSGVGLQIDARYTYGIKNVGAIEGQDWKFRDVRVLAGVKFGL